jgi:hypothetical protein
MTSPPKSVSIIKMLAANEEAVGRLYEAYAGKFPEHEEFWFGLAMEEADLSNWIFELLRKVNEGSASIYEDRFQAEDMQKFHNYLKEQLDKVKQEKISLVNALCTALDIEKSLVERGFLQVFEGDSEETLSVLEYLTSATGNHIKVIQRQLEQQKEL